MRRATLLSRDFCVKPFDYYEAQSVEEALRQMASLRGKRVRLLAGGTDLIVQMKDGVDYPDAVIHLGGIKELREIQDMGEALRIGAAVSFAAIERSPLVQQSASVLVEASREMAAPQISNRATIGGNIINASPAANSIPPLYVLRATLRLRSENGERRIPVEDFFTGPGKTQLRDEEILISIEVPKMKPSERGFFLKIGQRRIKSIAKVSVAAVVDVQEREVRDVRIALGAVAPTVIRARRAEECLRGKELTAEIIDHAVAAAAAEACPIDDIRSTAEYRCEMCRVLLQRGLQRLAWAEI
jgi:xanthine dehydrogenase FAD-binding subunit